VQSVLKERQRRAQEAAQRDAQHYAQPDGR